MENFNIINPILISNIIILMLIVGFVMGFFIIQTRKKLNLLETKHLFITQTFSNIFKSQGKQIDNLMEIEKILKIIIEENACVCSLRSQIIGNQDRYIKFLRKNHDLFI